MLIHNNSGSTVALKSIIFVLKLCLVQLPLSFLFCLFCWLYAAVC